MRVFAAALSHETNSFSPLLTSRDAFDRAISWRPGEHPARPSMPTAAFWVTREAAAQRGYAFVSGSCFHASPSGLVARSAYESMRDEIVNQVTAAGSLDAVILDLHGAMMADGYKDCEADLLGLIRQVVGPKVVIGILLDLHCHLTVARCLLADVVVLYKEYPHTDFIARAQELLNLVLRTVRAEIQPIASVWDCRFIANLPTTQEPMRSFVDRLQQLEGQENILSVSVAHSWCAGDAPECGARVLVVTDNAKSAGDTLARCLGEELAKLHPQVTPHLLEPDVAIDTGLQMFTQATTKKPVTIADTTDNPGGGAPGDNTDFLRLLIERRATNCAVGPIWDPLAVNMAFDAGVGAKITLRIGGKTCWASGEPVDAQVEVVACVSDAHQSFAGTSIPLGKSVGLRTIEGVYLALVSNRGQGFGIDLFSNLGIDPLCQRLLVVKSNQHFYAAFAPVSEAILYATGRGLMATDVRQHPWRHVKRPIWPLDALTNPRLVL